MKIDHLTLLVSSLEHSMRYYEALLPLLGFLKKRDHVWSNSSGFFLQFREATTGSRPYERYGAGMNHIGFAAETPTQVHAIRESMLAAGFDVPEIQNLSGGFTYVIYELHLRPVTSCGDQKLRRLLQPSATTFCLLHHPR